MPDYTCIGCKRVVDTDLEPGPDGRRCPDCARRADAEFAEWVAEGWS
ncbi:hypothetical protein [Nocardioides sp. YIM 152315]|nr:hypothetical protein [Nocardioides sp. YIM 152315]